MGARARVPDRLDLGPTFIVRDLGIGVQRVRLFGIVYLAPAMEGDLQEFAKLVEDIAPNSVAAGATNPFAVMVPMGNIGAKDVRARARELLIQIASSGMPHP